MAVKFKTKDDFSCGGLVWDDEKRELLLVLAENLSKKRVWTFPKGHPEKGESDETAAIREVREETGWDCEIDKKLIDVSYFYIHEKIRYHKTVRWFLMKPVKKSGDFDPEEILETKWASVADAKTLVSYDSDVKLLDALGR